MGTPQGAVASPLLANVYLHYVFDLWAQQWRRREATGNAIFVRYADDSAPRRREDGGILPSSHAAQEMRAGPSEPVYRRRLQTTHCCCV
jgi:hypothetical protein